MKRLSAGIFGICFSLFLAAVLFGCGKKEETGQPMQSAAQSVKEERMDFQKIKINETTARAEATEYLAEQTKDGVRLEYSVYSAGNESQKRIIHAVEGDEELYEKIAVLLGTFHVDSWNGFDGNDPDALDGSSFLLEGELSGGKWVSAEGQNAFPEGYRDFVNRLDELCAKEIVSSTSFDTGDYTFTVPESWKQNVVAVYRDGMIGFELPGKARDLMILCFYEAAYEDSNSNVEYTTLASFLKDDKTYFVKMRPMIKQDMEVEDLSETQQAICKSLYDDMKTIQSGFQLKPGLEQVSAPETPEYAEEGIVTAEDYPGDPNAEIGPYEEGAAPENAENDGTEEGGETEEFGAETGDNTEENAEPAEEGDMEEYPPAEEEVFGEIEEGVQPEAPEEWDAGEEDVPGAYEEGGDGSGDDAGAGIADAQAAEGGEELSDE